MCTLMVVHSQIIFPLTDGYRIRMSHGQLKSYVCLSVCLSVCVFHLNRAHSGALHTESICCGAEDHAHFLGITQYSILQPPQATDSFLTYHFITWPRYGVLITDALPLAHRGYHGDYPVVFNAGRPCVHIRSFQAQTCTRVEPTIFRKPAG